MSSVSISSGESREDTKDRWEGECQRLTGSVYQQSWNKKLHLICDRLARRPVSMQFHDFMILMSYYNSGFTSVRYKKHKPMCFGMTSYMSRWMRCERLIGLQPYCSTFQFVTHLLGFAELFHYLGSHLKVLQQVVGHSVSNPRGPLGRPELQQLVPSLLVRVDPSTSEQKHQYFSSFPVHVSSSLCRCINGHFSNVGLMKAFSSNLFWASQSTTVACASKPRDPRPRSSMVVVKTNRQLDCPQQEVQYGS